ncbi:hypothetical protein ES703_26815 [subsurface metagenome]
MAAPSCALCRLAGALPSQIIFNEAIARDMVKAGVCRTLRAYAHGCRSPAALRATRALATAIERIARIPPPPNSEP